MAKTSQNGLKDIILHEGLRRKAYLCSAGVPTIGVGHTKGVKLGDTCTIQQAYNWLAEDVKESEQAVQNLVKVPLKQHEFDALVSFVFNIGATKFRRSTLLRMLNSGLRLAAAKQFGRWIIGGAGLVLRRERETKLFTRGIYASNS